MNEHCTIILSYEIFYLEYNLNTKLTPDELMISKGNSSLQNLPSIYIDLGVKDILP